MAEKKDIKNVNTLKPRYAIGLSIVSVNILRCRLIRNTEGFLINKFFLEKERKNPYCNACIALKRKENNDLFDKIA